MEQDQQKNPVIVFDSKEVFSELESDYIQQFLAICGVQAELESSIFEVYGSGVKEVGGIKNQFESFLKTEVLAAEVEESNTFDGVVERIKNSWHKKEKKKAKGEHIIMEACENEFDQNSFQALLQGPDFPPNLNIGAEKSPLQTFDFRIVLPSNILEMFITYEYLKTHYNVPDSKFVFYHQLGTAIDQLTVELKIEPSDVNSREGCDGRIWIVLAQPERFSSVYEKYPNLLNSSIVYS